MTLGILEAACFGRDMGLGLKTDDNARLNMRLIIGVMRDSR